MFLTFGSYPLRLTTGTPDRSFIVYFQRRHVSYSSHVRSEIRWLLRVNGEGCGRNRQMKKTRNKKENYGHENLLIFYDSEPSMQSRFKLCTQPKPASFTTSCLLVISVTARWRKKGEPKLTHFWIIYVFILNFIVNFERRNFRLDAEFDVSLNFFKF